MSSSHYILEDFTYSLAACSPKVDLDDILTIVKSSQQPTIAVVNSKESPIGIVNGHRLLAFLVKKCLSLSELTDENTSKAKTLQDNTQQTLLIDREQMGDRFSDFVHTFELTEWIEPIVRLKSDLSREEILSYFEKEIAANMEQKNYIVVDPEGKLLGLLDTFRLSQWLFFHPTKFDRSLQSRRQLSGFITESLPFGQKVNKKPLLDLSIFNLIESIPIPLMLQIKSGKALYKNKYWREQVKSSKISNTLKNNNFVNSIINPLQQFEPNNNQQIIKEELTPYCQKGNYYLSPYFANLSPQPITFESPNILDIVSQKLISNSVYLEQDNQQSSLVLALDLLSSLVEKNDSQETWQYIKLPLNLTDYQLSTEDLPSQAFLIVAIDTKNTEKNNQDKFTKNTELFKLNHLKDKFLAGIGHELKSPLTAIIGLSNLLKEQKLGQLNQRQIRYAELIYRSGRQLMKIVNDMLELTYLSTGKLKLNLESIKIKSLCEEVYQKVLTRLEESNKLEEKDRIQPQCKLSIEPGLDIVVADEVRLRQILIYLLDNALKFTQIEETRLSQLERSIGITINHWSNWIAVTIWDNGNVIPEEAQHLLLEQCFPSENPLDYHYQDTGLGLILAQQLARAHGGDISFLSHFSQGNKFTVLLPSSAQQISPKITSNSPSISSLRQSLELSYQNYQNKQQLREYAIAPKNNKQNLLVLVIESVVAQINELDVKLRELGYYPIIARTDTEALYKARQLQPSKILLNPYLSTSSNTDILSLLKSDSRTCKIPVFLIVANQEKQRTSYSQADGLLTLPIELKKLRKLIPSVKKEYFWKQKRLTILHLYPESEVTSNLKITRNSDLNFALNEHLSGLNHRVLEADSLEQGELLARIWQLDAIVLDGRVLKEPLKYLRSLRESENLSSLPLITLDAQTTEAANLTKGLSVFPCLLPEEESNLANLVQVIQIAAGIDSNQ